MDYIQELGAHLIIKILQHQENLRQFSLHRSSGRNSDIWTSYVICKLAETSKDVIAFGAPYVKQYRNPHNLWLDLKDELPNNLLTDYFVNLLSSIKLKKSSYMDMLLSLINKSLNKIKKEKIK